MAGSIFYCIEGEDGRPLNFYDEKSKTWFTPTFTNRNEATKFAIFRGLDCDSFEITRIRLVIH